jgi:hypothetical protein
MNSKAGQLTSPIPTFSGSVMDSKDDDSKDDGDDGEDDSNDGRNGDSSGGGGGEISGEVGGEVGGVVGGEVSGMVGGCVLCLVLTYHRNRTGMFWNKFNVVKICLLNSIWHVQTCPIELILLVPIPG